MQSLFVKVYHGKLQGNVQQINAVGRIAKKEEKRSRFRREFHWIGEDQNQEQTNQYQLVTKKETDNEYDRKKQTVFRG